MVVHPSLERERNRMNERRESQCQPPQDHPGAGETRSPESSPNFYPDFKKHHENAVLSATAHVFRVLEKYYGREFAERWLRGDWR